MEFYIILLTLILAVLTSSTPLHPRAGGPTSTPIPSNCSQTNPLPRGKHHSHSVSGYKPDPDFSSLNLLYESYFDEPSRTDDQLAKQCFEQCYGYDDKNECISALSGKDIPVPKGYYGSPGGQLMTGCLLFKEYLNPGVFVESEKGTWVDMRGVDLSCPEE